MSILDDLLDSLDLDGNFTVLHMPENHAGDVEQGLAQQRNG